MKYYYTIKDSEITSSADWAFEEGMLETNRKIIRGRDGKLYFEGEEPPILISEVRTSALEMLRLRKWEAKNAGITVNGIAIDTDDRGQATISGAVMNVMIDPDFTAHWKTSDVDEHGGAVWVYLAGPIILGLAKAMTEYTESCFNVEALKQAQIMLLKEIADINIWLEEQLNRGWPSRKVTI